MNTEDTAQCQTDEGIEYMRKAQAAAEHRRFAGVYGLAGGAIVSPEAQLRGQLLALAVQHHGGDQTEDVLDTARKFVDFVFGANQGVIIDKALEPGVSMSDTLAATDAESEAVRKPDGARVSYAYMMSRIRMSNFTYPPSCPHMTVAEVTFDNGFTIIGSSAPADPKNFDVKLGQKYALENAIRQAWPLFGFLLCEVLHKGYDATDFLPQLALTPDPDPSTDAPEPSPTASGHDLAAEGADSSVEFPPTPHFG